MMSPPEADRGAGSSRSWMRAGFWARIALGVVGLGVVVWMIVSVGPDKVVASVGPALPWVPLICLLEMGRMAAETLAARIAFGSRASLVPLAALFRANVIGQSIANVAPAPRVVNETIKASLLAPHAGVPTVTSVGLTIQAATLTSVGLFSLPCGLAIYLRNNQPIWVWAALIHAFVLVGTGIALRAMTVSRRFSSWLAKRFPRWAPGASMFSDHASETGLWAAGPTLALMGNRACQMGQIAVAAHAVGVDVDVLSALAAEGVNLIAAAVGVMVPGGFGTTDGAFTLAADLLRATALQATSMALLLRCAQIVWLAVGSAILFSIKGVSVGSREG